MSSVMTGQNRVKFIHAKRNPIGTSLPLTTVQRRPSFHCRRTDVVRRRRDAVVAARREDPRAPYASTADVHSARPPGDHTLAR